MPLSFPFRFDSTLQYLGIHTSPAKQLSPRGSIMLHKYKSKYLVVSCISSKVSFNTSKSKVAVYLKRPKQVAKTPLFSVKSNLKVFG